MRQYLIVTFEHLDVITIDEKQLASTNQKMYGWVQQRLISNYYQHHGYYVLPTLPEKFRSRVIVYPHNLEKENNRSGLVTKFVNRITKDISEMKRALAPLHITRDISILPTTIGGQGSFHIKENEYRLYVRTDRSSLGVLLLILSAYFTDKQIAEKKRDDSTHWNITQSSLPDFINSLHLTFKGKPVLHNKPQKYLLNMHQSGNYAVESAHYLDTLGYPLKKKLGTSPRIPSLSEQENNILKKLIEQRQNVVSFATLSEELRGEFSLYAISKTITRIRQKLQDFYNDSDYNPIHCERGKGYVLYD